MLFKPNDASAHDRALGRQRDPVTGAHRMLQLSFDGIAGERAIAVDPGAQRDPQGDSRQG